MKQQNLLIHENMDIEYCHRMEKREFKYKKLKAAPEQDSSSDNLQVAHYLIRGRIDIHKSSKLDIIMD